MLNEKIKRACFVWFRVQLQTKEGNYRKRSATLAEGRFKKKINTKYKRNRRKL